MHKFYAETPTYKNHKCFCLQNHINACVKTSIRIGKNEELLHRHNNISAQISDKLITQKNTIHIQVIKNNVTQCIIILF